MPLDRMQILVTPEQRRRLTSVSQERGEPVTALVREAIDRAFPVRTDGAARRAAARQLLERDVPFRSPAELDEILGGRFDLPE